MADQVRVMMNHASRWVLVVLLLAAGAGAIRAQGANPSPDNGLCVWPWLMGNIDAQTPTILATAQSTGFDTIYLHLYRTTGPSQGTMYMADESGTWNPAWGSLTPYVTLSNFINQAHAMHIQVVGVFGCFLSGSPLPGNAPHEQLLRDVAGYLFHTYGAGNERVYKLDGLALDRVRYYGGNNSPGPVTSFVASMKAVLGLYPLSAFLIASPYYIDGGSYNASFLTYSSAMSQLSVQFGQNWEQLAPSLAEFLPMAYTGDGGVYGYNTTYMQAYTAKVAEFGSQAIAASGSTSTVCMTTIQTYVDAGGSGTATASTITACATGALMNGGSGFCAYRYYPATSYPTWYPAMAALSVPLPNRPRAALAASALGLTITLDASAVSDLDQPSSTLEVRFDVNGDGIADTPFSTTKTHVFVASGPGVQTVGMEVRDATGLRNVTTRRVSAGDPLVVAPFLLSATFGGTSLLTINVSPSAAGSLYLLAASATGWSPAYPIGNNLAVPLVYDSLTAYALTQLNGPIFQNFAGVLDTSGSATASFVIPPGLLPPSAAGLTLYFAGAGFDPQTLSPLFVTNWRAVAFLP